MSRNRARVPLSAAVLGAAFLHIAAALRTPLGAASDDALHLLLARNLLAGGFAVPGPAGVPVTDPLPGFPALMSLPAALLAPHWGLLRAVPLAASALLVWATWRLARRLVGEEAALFVAGLVAFNHTLIGWAGVVLPDILYAAVSVLAVAGAPAPLAAAGALLRPHGALLAAAASLGRGWKPGLRFAAVAFLPLSLWSARNLAVAGSASAYVTNAKDQAGLLAAWSTMPAHVWKLVGECLGRGALGLPAGPLAGLGGLALLAACAWGARSLLRRRQERPVISRAAVYLGALMLLHLLWRPWQSRYSLAVLPFVWIAVLAAVRPLLESRKPMAWALIGLLAVPGLSRGFGYAFEGLAAPRVEPWPRAAAWLRANVPAGDRVVSLDPYLVTLVSGREAAFPRPASSREAWLDAMRARGERWVFLRDLEARGYLSAEARDLMRSFDAWAVPRPPLSAAFRDKDEGVVMLRLD